MLPIEEIISQEYVDDLFKGIKISVYTEYMTVSETYELFMRGYLDGHARLPKDEVLKGYTRPPNKKSVWVDRGRQSVYTLGYQLGRSEIQANDRDPDSKIEQPTHIYIMLGFIGRLLSGDGRPYQQLYKKDIKDTRLRIIWGEG